MDVPGVMEKANTVATADGCNFMIDTTLREQSDSESVSSDDDESYEDSSEAVLFSIDECKPNSDIAKELEDKHNVLSLPDMKMSISKMVELACINNHGRRIPRSLYSIEKIPLNKQRRIKAAIT